MADKNEPKKHEVINPLKHYYGARGIMAIKMVKATFTTLSKS